MNMPGKLRRRGAHAGYQSDWKKAIVTLKARPGNQARGAAGLTENDDADEKLSNLTPPPAVPSRWKISAI
jgi:hypothetical protein